MTAMSSCLALYEDLNTSALFNSENKLIIWFKHQAFKNQALAFSGITIKRICCFSLRYFNVNLMSLSFTVGQRKHRKRDSHIRVACAVGKVTFLHPWLHVLELVITWNQRRVQNIGSSEMNLRALFYLTLEAMQLLWEKRQICRDKALFILVLSVWHRFSSSCLTAPAGVDKPQIVVQSATDADGDGSWFDPLHYTRSQHRHQFFRAQKCINRRVLRVPLKSPDEDKIPTKMHKHLTHTHTSTHPHPPGSKSWMRPDSHTLQERDKTRKNGIQCCIFNHLSCDFTWSADTSSICVFLHVRLISQLWVPPVI